MDRKTFLQSLLFMPVLGSSMKLNELEKLTSELENTERMPVLFIGHGNPMYAITDNPYRTSWMELGKRLSPPKAILCISAHWLTRGTAVTMTDKPKTIHDFGGFPDELFKVQYPAPGAAAFAKMAIEEVKSVKVHEDFEWGLDHGAWSVLRNMYPQANVPVFQMSLDYTKPASYHYELAKELSKLRNKGVLIVASGNVVHNLGAIKWGEQNPKPYDWAIEFDTMVKKSVEDNNFQALVDYQKMGNVASMAHPSNDHYLPLLYAMGLRDPKEKFSFFNDSFDMGSLSMRSMIFG
jgi:4,5-DOPA dioxygenase extradiol